MNNKKNTSKDSKLSVEEQFKQYRLNNIKKPDVLISQDVYTIIKKLYIDRNKTGKSTPSKELEAELKRKYIGRCVYLNGKIDRRLIVCPFFYCGYCICDINDNYRQLCKGAKRRVEVVTLADGTTRYIPKNDKIV